MRLNRREFQALAAAFLASSVLGGRAQGAAAPVGGLSHTSLAVQTLNRLTFGATPAAIAEFEAMGKAAWLERELSRKTADDTALAERLAAATLRIEYEADNDGEDRAWPARNEEMAYAYLDITGEQVMALIDYATPMSYVERIRPANEVQAASLIRAVHAQGQLREVMAQFWHNHFNVNAFKDEITGANFPAYDKVMRDNALGNFRVMLGAMARSPSMLFYLNNEASRASPANENFGRELLELHTLGAENYFNDLYDDWKAVPGAEDGAASGYIDQDVYEVARAFTGWSFGDGRWLAEGDEAPRTGLFHYIDGWHDPYQKRILGHEFRPNQGPEVDGDQVLDLLATHPGTARFIARKMIRRLLIDAPDEAFVDEIAGVFLEHAEAEDQLAQVVRAIVMAEVFDATPPQKLKRPFEFLASLYRGVGAGVKSPTAGFVWHLNAAGWAQHEHRPPNGPSDKTEDWANTNTINGLLNLSLYAFEDWFGAAEFDLSAALPADRQSWGGGFEHWMELLNAADTADVRQFMADIEADPDAPLPETNDDGRDWVLRSALSMASMTPQFLFR